MKGRPKSWRDVVLVVGHEDKNDQSRDQFQKKEEKKFRAEQQCISRGFAPIDF